MLDSTESNGANAQDEPATTVSPPRSSSKDTQDALIGINGGVSDIKNSIKRLVKYTLAESDSEDDDKHKKHSGTALNDDNPGNDSADSDLEGVGTSADPLSKTLDGIEPDHAFKTPDENRSELIPNVRDCNTDQFKTRVQDEKLHVIDVLLAPASPKMAVTSEDPHKPKGKTIALPVPKPDKTETPQTQDTNAWIHRIRINSPVLIQHLREFGNQDGLTQSGPVHKENKPWTFMRPFQYLIHYQDAMKGRLEEIRATDKLVVNNAHRISDPALSHLQCYIDFLEDRVMPCYRRLQEISSEEMPKVRFDDLWYIFKFGGLIYVPSNEHSEANASQKMSTFQSLRRIYRIQNPLHGDESFTDDLCKRSGCDRSNQAWITYCYYIDFDGEAFGAITEKLEIKPYSGEKQVDQLGFYPIEYLKDSHEILSKAKDDGQKVVNAIQQRYGFYSGWTLTTGPLGKGLVDSEGYDIKNSSHIESDVLVDYREAFSSFPPWRPGLQKRTKDSLSMYVNVHSKSIRQAGPKNTKRSSVDRIVYDDGIESLEFNRYLEKDRNLKIDKSRPVTEKNDVMNLPSGEDLALVPRRIIAYVVWERRFVHLDVRHLKIRDQKGNEEAFDQLEIGETHKKLIKSLVQSHFQKKKVEQKEHIDIETQDLIRGKGKGTIMLLHGVPGVGKTATAEAVAQKWSKPLFPITCGDLGFTAESVETSLNGIFRLAHLWDCVLLLDEADVFIAQRRSGDLQRNALVSVFLRMLEYYNGILFLTTNRAGVLDEAVKSRVHLILGYDHLDDDQTVKIFEHNITKIKQIEKQRSEDSEHKPLAVNRPEVIQFAKEHCKKHPQGQGRWNGRQIRNAFLIAASLAHYGNDVEDEPQDPDEPPLQKQLHKSHLEEVERTTLEYDKFRHSIYRRTDDEIAFHNQERNNIAASPPDTPRTTYG